MRRRDVIFLGGAAVVGPAIAHAQPSVPVIGLLTSAAPKGTQIRLARLRAGLKEAGLVDGQNALVRYDQRLPMAEQARALVQGRVSAIVAIGNIAALAAKAATDNVPIVFQVGGDPVKLGLVERLNRPGGNLTGVSRLGTVTETKRLELLRELVPSAQVIAVLVNPNSATTPGKLKELQEAAALLQRELQFLQAGGESDLTPAFESMNAHRIGALLVASDNFLSSQSERLAELTTRFRLPAIMAYEEFTQAGGLASYGSSSAIALAHCGRYVGRILKGERAGDLPVIQSTDIEFVVNLKTARSLNIEIPLSLLGRADEVIE